MTEEEKKAIAYLRFYSNDDKDEYFDKTFKIDKFFCKKILNLIEKLQKENEDLTEVNHEQGQCYCQAKVEIENLREKRDKYYLLISKIRERLQKEYDLYNSKEQLKYSQDIIDVLQELLEEG